MLIYTLFCPKSFASKPKIFHFVDFAFVLKLAANSGKTFPQTRFLLKSRKNFQVIMERVVGENLELIVSDDGIGVGTDFKRRDQMIQQGVKEQILIIFFKIIVTQGICKIK